MGLCPSELELPVTRGKRCGTDDDTSPELLFSEKNFLPQRCPNTEFGWWSNFVPPNVVLAVSEATEDSVRMGNALAAGKLVAVGAGLARLGRQWFSFQGNGSRPNERKRCHRFLLSVAVQS